jgi:4-amino-4-deoxy-L-arabinose transferase-like glycosyltransferase
MNMPMSAANDRDVRTAASTTRWALSLHALLLGAIYLIVWGLRAIYLGRSFDIFYDELIYLHISENVAHGLGVKYYTSPFYLHPPLFFLIEAAYLRLIAPAGTLIDHVYAARYLNSVVAALSAVLLFLIGRRVAGWWAGLLAASVFALDPFVIRINSRNLIETVAMFWVLAGYCLMLAVVNTRSEHEVEGLDVIHTWAARAKAVLSRPRRVATGSRRPAEASPYATSQIEARAALTRQASPRVTQVISWQLADMQAPAAQQGSWPRILAVGAAFGLALLSKEPTAMLTLLPLAICFVLGWGIARRTSALIGITSLAIYAIYPIYVFAFGDVHQFLLQKFRGFSRFTGAVQESGFNQHGGPSFTEAIVRNFNQFATTYFLLVSGIVAICVLLMLAGSLGRLLAIWTTSAYIMKVFLVLFGTNEEQYFYYLVAMSILASATAIVVFLRSPDVARAIRRRYRIAALVLFVAFCGWTGYLWIDRHFTPDNGYERLYAYLQQHVPAGATIATTTNPSNELLKGSDYETGMWGTVEDVQNNGAQYVLLSTLLVEKGYDAATPELYQWLTQHAQPVFTFTGPTNGDLVLYRVDK